jgi:alpha-1,6-mannosyltransferase
VRIAQLANFVGPASGGMKTAMSALGRGYVEAGAERLLVMPGPTDTRVSTEAGEVVTLRAPKVGGGYRLMLEPWRVIDLLEEFAPTSVEISDKSTLLPVSRWARKHGVGSVLFSHEHLQSMLSLRTGLESGFGVPVAVFNRVLVRAFDAVVVTSRFAASEFPAATPLHRIPLGVDLETFHPSRATPRADGVLRLVHAGRLSREKSPQLAVATAAALHRRGVRVRLDVFGDGPHRDEIEEAAEDAPVFFHGHIASRAVLAEHLARADVAISVCPGETFGLAVLEALACGTPVVTANRGGARELVDSTSGAWGDPDPESLADAVLRIVARPCAGRRTAARRRAEKFPWSATTGAMLDLHARWATGPAVASA